MYGRDRQQRRDRSVRPVGLAIAQDQDPRPAGDCLAGRRPDVIESATQAGPALGHRVETPDDRRAHPVLVAVDHVVGVQVDQLGQLVIPQDGLRQQDLVAGLRGRVQQIALRAEGGRQAGHHLLADGVQRRIGDLREQLLEVVEQHARARREHGDGGVGAHRTEGLGTGARHRRDQQVQLFVGEAERLLPGHHTVVRHPDVGALRQVVQVELLGVQPLPVGAFGGQFGLDLLIGDDPSLFGVDQEHPSGLQAQALDDVGRIEFQHAGLGGHDHQSVVGHPDPGGPQTVAVEHRSDDGAVGEAHRGRTVPGLHQRRVVCVERAAGRVHRLVALPGLRDHHQHGVRQAATAEVQQFQHLVEARAVGGAGGADREDLLHAGPEDVGVDQRLTGPHPVLVAGHGVDLAVVGDPAERMRQRPGREGVGGEPRVHDAQRALQTVVLQIQVEGLQLRGGQHALVNQGLAGKAGEVDGLAAGAVLSRPLGSQFVLGALADHIGLALELHPGGATDEQLAEGRHGVARQRAQRGVVGGNVAPAQHRQALGFNDLAHTLASGGGIARGLRQEGDAGGIGALGRQFDALFGAHRAQERVRYLEHDSRTVATVGLGAGGTAVLQVHQRGDGFVHDVAAAPAVHVHDHRDTAGVVFVCGVVEPDISRHTHLTLLSRGDS